jgi:hypothetical protein
VSVVFWILLPSLCVCCLLNIITITLCLLSSDYYYHHFVSVVFWILLPSLCVCLLIYYQFKIQIQTLLLTQTYQHLKITQDVLTSLGVRCLLTLTPNFQIWPPVKCYLCQHDPLWPISRLNTAYKSPIQHC